MSFATEPGLFAFVAGLASFLSPCVFPLVPVYAGFLGGRVASLPGPEAGSAIPVDHLGSAAPGVGASTAASAGPGSAGPPGSMAMVARPSNLRAVIAAPSGAGAVIPATGGAGPVRLGPGRAEPAPVHGRIGRRPRRAPALTTGLAFTAGFSAVFVLLFYVLAALELPFQASHRRLIDTVSGVIIIVLALQLMGVLRIGALMRERKLFHAAGGHGLLPGFLLGVSFAAGWTPCIGVQLGAILTVAAGGSFSALPFMLLYCAGLAIPFLLVAALADRLQATLRAVNRRLGMINLVAGGLLLVFGMLLITDQVTFFNSLAASGPLGT